MEAPSLMTPATQPASVMSVYEWRVLLATSGAALYCLGSSFVIYCYFLIPCSLLRVASFRFAPCRSRLSSRLVVKAGVVPRRCRFTLIVSDGFAVSLHDVSNCCSALGGSHGHTTCSGIAGFPSDIDTCFWLLSGDWLLL